MHAAATESLLPFLGPGKKVLDVGSGSGYLTAVLAEIVFGEGPGDGGVGSERGKVIGLEHIVQLKDLGERNMRKGERGRKFIDDGKVQFVLGDGRKGWREGLGSSEGYDAIHVGAAALELHQELVDQLNSPGRYVFLTSP
jgi:protein-L-isoaspartate(D-aspartate) O-methyltransferase